MAQGFFAKENAARQKEVLEKIENCTKRETEKILVREFGTKALPPKREVVQAASGDEALLHVRLKHETLKKLDRLKSLRAHKNPRMSYFLTGAIYKMRWLFSTVRVMAGLLL